MCTWWTSTYACAHVLIYLRPRYSGKLPISNILSVPMSPLTPLSLLDYLAWFSLQQLWSHICHKRDITDTLWLLSSNDLRINRCLSMLKIHFLISWFVFLFLKSMFKQQNNPKSNLKRAAVHQLLDSLNSVLGRSLFLPPTFLKKIQFN